MRERFGALLEGGSYISVLAAWAASLLTIALGFLAGVALAQGGGDVNIDARDCSQVQAIFIRQLQNGGDNRNNGATIPETTPQTTADIPTAASDQYDKAIVIKISQRIDISQEQVLTCLNGGAGATTNVSTPEGTTPGTTTAVTTPETIGETTAETTATTTATTTNATTTHTTNDSTTPTNEANAKGKVIAGSFPDKELPNTGGSVAILAPAGALLAIAAGVGLLLAVRRR